MKRSGFVILAIIAVLVIWVVTVRNGLATAQTGIDGKWGDVQTQFQRKKNMYENVVATIKGAARNEDTTLQNIVKMRSRIPDVPANATPEELAAADKQYNQLGRAALNINVEAYPTLQATGLYKDLQAQVEGTENRVTVALRDWNQAITDFNTRLVRFPTNLIAGMFGFKAKANYKADEDAKDTKIDFSK
ncbi:MAG: LemA family protein [Bacteroidetes bacterium]|nr:LemA family protein [Bacteroidota bacterium]